MTDEQFLRNLAFILAAFPTMTLTENAVAVYRQKLIGFEHKALVAALSRIMEKGRFFPSIAEILAELEAAHERYCERCTRLIGWAAVRRDRGWVCLPCDSLPDQAPPEEVKSLIEGILAKIGART